MGKVTPENNQSNVVSKCLEFIYKVLVFAVILIGLNFIGHAAIRFYKFIEPFV